LKEWNQLTIFFHVAENGERKELTVRRGHAFKVILF